MIEIFFEFIKYHNPTFRKVTNGYVFCYNLICNNCKIVKKCKSEKFSLIESDYELIKSKYPEYFI